MNNIEEKKASLFGKKGQQIAGNKQTFTGGNKKKAANNLSAPKPSNNQPPRKTVMKAAARGR
ncbi:MAG: hypothetical protein ACRC5R_05670 [Mycoplasmatales bacterium]